MADAITIKALQDASLDAKSLEEVVNGNEVKQVTTRKGETYPSVKKAIKTLFENGGLPATPFKTKALMTASALVDGQYAMVTDETANNGLYVKTAGAWVKSKYDVLNTVTRYADIKSGIALNNTNPEKASTEHRVTRAIKELALKGDYENRIITIASLNYTNGVFNFILASPESRNADVEAHVDARYVARYSATNTFSGVQKLTLEPYGDNVEGYVIIDFDELQPSDVLSSNYNARNRLVDLSKVVDLNSTFYEMKEAKDSVLFVIGSDPKNDKLNSAVQEIAFFDPLPRDKYLVLAALFRDAGDSTTLVMQIFVADDKTSKGVLWKQGAGKIQADGTATLIFNNGYVVVDTLSYYPDNNGAAISTDNATFKTRGINKHFIKKTLTKDPVRPLPYTQFNSTGYYHVPTAIRQRAVKLYVKGGVEPSDYYVLNTLIWSLAGGKYRLTYQIKKLATPDQPVSEGLIVYSGNINFDSLDDIKGTVEIDLTRANKHPNDAVLEVDLNQLGYNTIYNRVDSPYIFNSQTVNYINGGFNVDKLKHDSSSYFATSSGGLAQYKTLSDALAVKETGLFAIGGNTFKSRTDIPTSKADYICTNNPPKLLSKKPISKEYDFYYKGIKTRLEIVDSDDVFYFVNSDYIIKVPQPLKQSLPEVANSAASDFTVFDVAANTYHSITGAVEVFTKTALDITSIGFVRLTYDNELLIISNETNRSIMFTENNQASLRTFTFNGSVGTKYTFGEGTDIIKDWCMSHHKNIMFFSDYDTGTDRGTTGGQKAHVSLDNGYTFTECFDFTGEDWSRVKNASNITSFNKAQAHIHSICYDPKQDVVWIVTGDGAASYDNSSLFYSKDLGQTWTHMRSVTADGGARTQHVMALPFDGCVAFGSDASNLNGVAVATYDNDTVITQEVAQDFVGGVTGLFAFARSTCSSVKHGVKYMSFGRNLRVNEPASAAKSFVAASSNGYKWEEVWSSHDSEVYGNVYCYDDSDGKLYVSLDGTTDKRGRVVVVGVSYE